MRHVLVALLYLLTAGHQQREDSSGTAAREIQALRSADVEATKRFDVEALVSLWSDDIVSIQPRRAPIVGKTANRAELEKMHKAASQIITIDYVQDWRDLQVTGNHAFEWGVFTSVFKTPNAPEPVTVRHNVLRVLRREKGGWKVCRTIWNEAG